MKTPLYLLMTLITCKLATGSEETPSSIEAGIEYRNTNGETCDSDDPWEYPCKYPLTCQNRFCTCPLPLQIYSEEEESCYSAIGGICRDSAGVNFTCVPGSSCSDATKTCNCLPRHKARKDGSACHPLKIIGEFCTEQSDCDDFLNFNCIDGKCACEAETQVYHSELKKCVALSGQKCDLSKLDECTDHSSCSEVSETCICNPDYSPSKNGQCGRGFEASCEYKNTTLSCSDIFSCVNGRCKCSDPYNEYYDPELNQCLVLVSGNCIIDDKLRPCGKNSECFGIAENGRYYFECRCSKGFLEDDRFCRGSFEASCDTKNLCAKPLECVDGTCKCANSLTQYDEVNRKCVGLVGSRCKYGELETCVEWAKCERDNFGQLGRCVCEGPSTHKDNVSRTCKS